MTPVIVSPRAEADETKILEYIASRAGARIAVAYGARFRDLFRTLREHPDSGASRPALGRDIRHKVFAPYLIIYRHQSGAVTILRILHGRQHVTGSVLRT